MLTSPDHLQSPSRASQGHATRTPAPRLRPTRILQPTAVRNVQPHHASRHQSCQQGHAEVAAPIVHQPRHLDGSLGHAHHVPLPRHVPTTAQNTQSSTSLLISPSHAPLQPSPDHSRPLHIPITAQDAQLPEFLPASPTHAKQTTALCQPAAAAAQNAHKPTPLQASLSHAKHADMGPDATCASPVTQPRTLQSSQRQQEQADASQGAAGARLLRLICSSPGHVEEEALGLDEANALLSGPPQSSRAPLKALQRQQLANGPPAHLQTIAPAAGDCPRLHSPGVPSRERRLPLGTAGQQGSRLQPHMAGVLACCPPGREPILLKNS